MSRSRKIVFYQRPVDPPALAEAGVVPGALWINTESAHLFGSYNMDDGAGNTVVGWRREGNDTVDWANITNKPDIPDELTLPEFIAFLNQAAPLANITDVVAGVNDDRIGLTPQLLNQAVAVLTSAVRGGSLVTLGHRPNNNVLYSRLGTENIGTLSVDIPQLKTIVVETLVGGAPNTINLVFSPQRANVVDWFVPIKYVYINGVRYHLGNVPGESGVRHTEGNLEANDDTAYKYVSIDSATRATFPAGAFLTGDTFTLAFEMEDGTLIPSGTTLSPASEFTRHLINEVSGRVSRNEEVLNDLVKVQDAPDTVDAGANAAATYQANFSYGLRYKRGVAKFDSDLIDHTSTISGGATISDPRTIRLNIQQTVDNGVYEIYIKKFAQAQDPIEVRGEADDGAGTLNVAYPLATTPGILRQEGGVVKVIIKRVGNTLNVSAVPFEVSAGPQGPQGIQGPAGPVGPQGPAGSGGGGGGGTAAGAFRMTIEAISASIVTTDDIPNNTQTFQVAIDVRGTDNLPTGDFSITLSALALTLVDGAPTLEEGANVIAVRIANETAYLTTVRAANQRGELQLQARIGAGGSQVNSEIYSRPVRPIQDDIPDRLRGRDYVDSGLTVANTGAPDYMEVNSGNLNEIQLNATTTNPIVAHAADGTRVVWGAASTLTVAIPSAYHANRDLYAAAGPTAPTGTNRRPADLTRRTEWEHRAGDSDYYVDTLQLNYSTTLTPAINTNPGGIAVGSTVPMRMAPGTGSDIECVDVTILSIDTRNRFMIVALRRNAYIRAGALTGFAANTQPIREAITSAKRFLIPARVFLSRAGLATEFDPDAAVPAGSVHIADIAMDSQGVRFYRMVDFPRITEFKNTCRWDYVADTAYRMANEGIVNVLGEEIHIPRGTQATLADAQDFLSRSRVRNGFYDVYLYVRQNGERYFDMQIPNKVAGVGYRHPRDISLCLLQMRVEQAGSTGSLTYTIVRDYNHYPWHRFNSEVKVSPVKSIKILPDNSSPILRHNFDNESDVSVVLISPGTESRGNTVSARRYSINFETGLYRDRPSVVLGQSTYGNQIDNRSDIKFLQDDTGITLLSFWSSTGDLHHINETGEIDVTFNRIGEDARQVELDNFKG